MIKPIVAAGLFSLVAPLPAPVAAQSQSSGQSLIVVTQASGTGQNGITNKRIRGLILMSLSKRGHMVIDGRAGAQKPGATILRITADRRILKGSYTRQATIGLRATLEDADTKRFIGRFDAGTSAPWRLATHCLKHCIEAAFQRRVRPLAVRLAADVDRSARRFNRQRPKVAVRPAGVGVAFRQIDRALLPQIEHYLRNFPGVTRIRRDYGASKGVLYRLSHDGTVRDTDLSLRKMLHHLRLKARIARNGNTYVVEADPAVKPSAGAQDW